MHAVITAARICFLAAEGNFAAILLCVPGLHHLNGKNGAPFDSLEILRMASIKILNKNPIRSFLDTQYKNLLLKPALKLLNRRGDYPAFWTMPHDTICREILLNGFYEKELLMGMSQLVESKAGTVLDIGANIGNHTVFFSRIFENVISFEPVPRNCWILKANLHLNQIRNVHLVEKGLGNKNERLFFHNDPRNTNDRLSRNNPSQASGENTVDVVIGDEELGKLGYPSPISMIKIDVEGLEPEVIMGLERTIASNMPMIYWEAFNRSDVDRSRTLLEKLGYEYFYHLSTNRYSNKLSNKLANSLGRNAYLKPLDQCSSYDGMNVAAPRKLI
jgi:FkbM family methyltransferase